MSWVGVDDDDGVAVQGGAKDKVEGGQTGFFTEGMMMVMKRKPRQIRSNAILLF